MRSQKERVLRWVGSIGLGVALILFGPLGMTASAQAVPEMILVTFSDPAPVNYTDLSGNLLGEGTLVGEVRCVGENCSQKIEFQPGDTLHAYEYKFKSRGVFDPVAQRVLVTGTGTILSAGSKTRFSFTAVFQDNGDGTVQATFIASTQEASFAFPAAPGTFTIQ